LVRSKINCIENWLHRKYGSKLTAVSQIDISKIYWVKNELAWKYDSKIGWSKLWVQNLLVLNYSSKIVSKTDWKNHKKNITWVKIVNEMSTNIRNNSNYALSVMIFLYRTCTSFDCRPTMTICQKTKKCILSVSFRIWYFFRIWSVNWEFAIFTPLNYPLKSRILLCESFFAEISIFLGNFDLVYYI